MLRLTQRSQQIVQAAMAAARQAGAESVRIAHLAHALLSLDEGMAHRLLAHLGADRAGLRETLAAAAGAAPVLEGHRPGPGAPVPFHPTAKALLEAAAQEAEELGHRYLGTEHLLLALAAAQDPAGETLRAAGISPDRTRRVVQELLGRL